MIGFVRLGSCVTINILVLVPGTGIQPYDENKADDSDVGDDDEPSHHVYV